MSIQFTELEFRPSKHESHPITTRPKLLSIQLTVYAAIYVARLNEA